MRTASVGAPERQSGEVRGLDEEQLPRELKLGEERWERVFRCLSVHGALEWFHLLPTLPSVPVSPCLLGRQGPDLPNSLKPALPGVRFMFPLHVTLRQ